MLQIFSSAILFICFNISLSQRHIGTIDCQTTLQSLNCRNPGCTGFCNEICSEYKDIWGTEIYTYDSPICIAAVHDFRISAWNTFGTVTFESLHDTEKYIGSKRLNIQTLDYGKEMYPKDGAYFFKSPRITEEILDIITLHHNYIFERRLVTFSRHKLECRVASNAANRKIYFSKFSGGQEIEAVPDSRGFYTKYWNFVDGFWCRPDKSMLSGVLSHVIPKNSHFIPYRTTITASIRDKISIQMNPISNFYKTDWTKNGKPFTEHLNRFFGKAKQQTKLFFNSLEIGDAGFYGLHDYNNRGAMVRLIVRVCEDGKFGPLCEHRCPACTNGGVCHDLTGDCICPPGFNGTFCENACKPGFFGRDCSQQCYNEDDQVTNCSEILFCLPDPYGCSCISGFTSLFCNQTCSYGYYGAGCTQNCSSHCNPSQSCEPTSGKCYGCKEGWHGTTCSLSYPVFKTPPVVKNISSNSIEFTFKEWKKNEDGGVGTPEYYEIQYKYQQYMKSEWMIYKRIKTNNLYHGTYVGNLENLLPDNTYDIRVVIIDVSGNAQLENVPVFSSRTTCGVPEEPPVDIQINATLSRKLSVTWKLPPPTTWNCKEVFVEISYNSSKNKYHDRINKQNHIMISTEPYTEWNLSMRVVNKDFSGNWSSVKNVISAQDAPSSVKNLTLLAIKIDQIYIAWDKPEKENGIITKYIITYQQESWRHSCNLTESVILEKKVDARKTSAYIDVYPYSNYIISVFAVTVKPGPEHRIDIQTEESVPVGPPQHLRIVHIEKDFVKLQWEPPICSLSYGNITEFKVTLNSLDPWESSHQYRTTSMQEAIISTLQPFTNYKARLYAGTNVGLSNYSTEINFRTESDKPPSPSNLTIYGSTENILFLSWRPPYPPKGILWKYEIQYHCEECFFMNKTVYTNKIKCPNEVGDNNHCYALSNLKNNEKYNISIWAYNKNVSEKGEVASIFGKTKQFSCTLNYSHGFGTAPTIIIALSILLNLIFTATLIISRNPQLRKRLPRVKKWNVRYTKEEECVNFTVNKLEEEAEPEQISEIKSQTTPIFQLENFVRIGLKSGEIRNQFLSVEKRQKQLKETSKNCVNKENIYETVLNHDCMRVILNSISKDARRYYVNANYINGYKVPKKYIATQGPKQLTINDFWSMVWQENVCKIIMLANSEENEKTKWGKYWPDSINTFQELTVTYLHTEMFADFVIRTFHVIKNKVIREIKHFHFTSWPDHGILTSPIAITNFIRKIRSYKSENVNPIVFHCSSEIRESGVLILIDRMLDMAAAENQVDLVSQLCIMRQEEINSVESLGQYCFVYECLVEALCREKTAIACPEYIITLKELKAIDPKTELTPFHIQFEKLNEISSPLKIMECQTASIQCNQVTGGNKEILPSNHTFSILKDLQENPATSNNNAIYVDKLRHKDAFLVTRIPFSETRSDFWRMAFFSKSSTIVLLNDLDLVNKDCHKYWPENSEIYENIEVKIISEQKHGEIIERIFELRNISLQDPGVSNVKIMKMFHLYEWMPNDILPSSAETILKLIEEVETWQEESGTFSAIVQCLNGVRACGLYCSSVFICDQIKYEQEVDVFSAVRIIRTNQPKFIENVDQYIFCHEVALTFLENFQVYANIQ